MKQAFYSKKFNSLTLFVQKNVIENVYCSSKKHAMLLIEKSNIDQQLIIN
jgi:hypothetical protein